MTLRASRSTVSFAHPFALAGMAGHLPAGDYEVLVEDELLQGLTFEAYRRSATYLLVRGQGGRRGGTEMRKITESALQDALGRDRALSARQAGAARAGAHQAGAPQAEPRQIDSDAALSPREDTT